MHKNKRKKKKTGRIVALVVAAVLLVLLAGGAIVGKKALGDARTLLGSVEEIKAEAGHAADALKALDIGGVEDAAAAIREIVRSDRELLEQPMWKTAAKVPGVGGDVDTAKALLDIALEAIDELALPALDVVRDNSDLSVALEEKDIGALLDVADIYVGLADESIPQVRGYMDRVMALPPMHVEKLENKMEQVRGYIRLAEQYLPAVEDELLPLVRDELLPPVREALGENKITDLIVSGNAINAKMASRCIRALEEIVPTLRTIPGILEGNALVQSNEKTIDYAAKAVGKLEELLALYDRVEPYIPIFKELMADGEDRTYLIAAQNSAEIRALGGFPGSIGIVYISDGVLWIYMFEEVYAVLRSYYYPCTAEEEDMFTNMIYIDHDAVVNPYFPAVASRWAANYEKESYGSHVSGVISITPAIIQDLLGVTGAITLTDGTELDGTNATAFIEHDIYVKYVSRADAKSKDLSDSLFGEIADKTIRKVAENLSMDNLEGYISILERRTKDRVIMFWFENEETEQIAHDLGCDGGFSTDPEHPQLGIYFSNHNASKMGWYLDLNVDVGDPEIHADGSRSYPVTVEAVNNLPRTDVWKVGYYVVGATEGVMSCRIHFSAPAGGSVTDFYCEGMERTYFVEHDYYGSKLTCSTYFQLYPESSKIIHFTVHTAPGVEEPLSVITTPTLSEYRRPITE